MRKTVVTLLLGLALAVAPAAPASALEREKVTLNPGDFIERKYPVIAGQNPTGEAQDVDTCRSAIYCDTIPLQINVPPSVPKDSNYIVQVRMFWETAKANGTTVNDLDMFIYNSDDEQLQKGATQSEPETINLAQPPAGLYHVTVVNYLGENSDGYRLQYKFLTDSSETPFELLDPENQGPQSGSSGGGDTDSPEETPTDLSDDPVEITGPPEVTIDTFSAPPDDAFDPDLFNDPPPTDSGGPGEFAIDPTEARATVDPANGLAVFLALVVLPLALAGGTGAYIWRRRSAMAFGS